MSKLLELTETFYDASWDFSTRLCLLPNQLTSQDDPEIQPDFIIAKYKEEIGPFLNLEGKDIPRTHHTTFDQLDTTIRNEVFPALDVLKEEWDELIANPKSITQASKLAFAEKSAYIANLVDMYVIAQAAEMRDELRLMLV